MITKINPVFFAADLNYRHCREFVDDILLVSDEEIITATLHLFERGLKVEPSGAAAFAALLHNKVPDVAGKKVVVMVTGSNISVDELKQISNCSWRAFSVMEMEWNAGFYASFVSAVVKLAAPFTNMDWLRGLTLIPAWICNHMPNKVWDEIIIHSQTSTVQMLQPTWVTNSWVHHCE